MAAAVRQPPAAFLIRLRQFPDFVDLRYNEAVGRWEFVFLSAAGREVSQFWGWARNPLTGAPIEPDPYTGLHPFRDLDQAAQDEIIKNCQQTFIGTELDRVTGNARRDRLEHMKGRVAYNEQLIKNKAKKAGDDYADMVAEMDVRRPWLKFHSPAYKRLKGLPS